MNLKPAARDLAGRQVDFLVLGSVWFIVGLLFQPVRAAPAANLAWLLLTSAISISALTGIGHFERYRATTKLSGILNLFIVLPSAALISKGILSWTSLAPTASTPAAIGISAGAAVLFESLRWGFHQARRITENRWDLETYLLEEEETALAAEMSAVGASAWIKVRSCGGPGRPGAAPGGRGTLVISRRAARDLKNCPELLSAHLKGQRIVDVSQLLQELRGRVRIRHSDAWTFLLGSTYQSPSIRLYFYLKAFLEPIMALLLILLLAPVLLGLALAVLLATGRPVLYRQERLGYKGERFFLYKFRTMPVTAESGGPQWAKENDQRVTPLGRWLRKTHLDELPQLINVARRELSFVGPRPERPAFYEILNAQIPLFPLRLMVRPGITGWAQSKQKYAGTVDECRVKLEYDLYYIKNMSPGFDVKVLVDTAGILVRGNGGR